MLLNALFVFSLSAALFLFADVLLSDPQKEKFALYVKSATERINKSHENFRTLFLSASGEPELQVNQKETATINLVVMGSMLIVLWAWEHWWLVFPSKPGDLNIIAAIFLLVLVVGGQLVLFFASLVCLAVLLIVVGLLTVMLARVVAYVLTRISAYQKGPLAAVSALVAGVIALLKLFSTG
jgi:hypothetical protein